MIEIVVVTLANYSLMIPQWIISLRLMESLSDPFCGLRVVVACHIGAYFPPHHFLVVWAFRATISLQLGVQSCNLFSVTTFRVVLLSSTFKASSFSVWRLEPPSLFNLAFRATISLQFCGQSHHLLIVWRLEPHF